MVGGGTGRWGRRNYCGGEDYHLFFLLYIETLVPLKRER